MQRWIALAVVVMFLGIGGMGFGYWKYKQGRPCPIWVPLQINREISDEKHQAIADDLSSKLRDRKLLLQISTELGLAGKLKLPSAEDAARELDRRMFVKVGEADTPMGKVPSINVGVDGTARDQRLSEEIVTRFGKEVAKIIGNKPSARSSF